MNEWNQLCFTISLIISVCFESTVIDIVKQRDYKSADMGLILWTDPSQSSVTVQSLTPDLVSVCTPTFSICSSPCPSSFCPFLSLYLCHSLYVQRAVAAWNRGQAPVQEELRDSHHEWRESRQSGLYIAAEGQASSVEGDPDWLWP